MDSPVKKILFAGLIICGFLAFNPALADTAGTTAGSQASSNCKLVGKDTICTLANPLKTTDAASLVNTIIKGLLGVIGAVTLLMFVWGAGGWLLSAGNPEKVAAGTKTMLWAAIGLILVFASYILVNIVIKTLTGG